MFPRVPLRKGRRSGHRDRLLHPLYQCLRQAGSERVRPADRNHPRAPPEEDLRLPHSGQTRDGLSLLQWFPKAEDDVLKHPLLLATQTYSVYCQKGRKESWKYPRLHYIYICFRPVPSSVHRRRWTTWCWRETTSCLQLAEPSCVTTTRPSSPSSPSSDTWRWTSRSLTRLCRSKSLQSCCLHRMLLHINNTWFFWRNCVILRLQGTAASTKNKLPTLITSMETIGAKALEEFADSIKATSTHFNIFSVYTLELFADFSLVWPQNDPDKEYNMPKDGTVHELTSNVSQRSLTSLLGYVSGCICSLCTSHSTPSCKDSAFCPSLGHPGGFLGNSKASRFNE